MRGRYPAPDALRGLRLIFAMNLRWDGALSRQGSPMRRAVLVLAFGFLAPSAFADDFSASIEVGRFGVMLDQAAAIERVPLPVAAEAPQDDLHARLVATVVRFNALAEQVCRKARLPAGDCAGPFTPDWLADGRPEADPARLRTMIDETAARIGTFWGDVCDTAPDRHSCDIE